MKSLIRLFLCLTWLATITPLGFAASSSATTGYLITNDDNGPGSPNTATFFTVAANGTLSNPTLVSLGGEGVAGGFFAASRVSVLSNAASPCVYISEGSTNSIAGIKALTQTVTGDYPASATDNGADNGIGMVMNSSYLYASFSTSATIATFAVEPGCALQFLSDISVAGLNGGAPKGMALYGNLLVVTYGDGSIESFDVASGLPISNGDEQNATGFASDDFPSGVTITADGHYAIFGDDSSGAAVEVSDISSGQLTPTVLYNLPSGFNSNNVLLSPDGTLLYVVNNTSGQVSASFFNATTGVVSAGCVSAQLRGFDSSFSFLSTPLAQLPGSKSSVLYIAEFGQPSAIAVINVSNKGGKCALREAAGSPVSDPNSQGLLSIGAVGTVPLGIYSPAPESTLRSSKVTFEWYGPSEAAAYQIDVGSSAGGSQYYQSGRLPASTLSGTVAALPTNGSTVYVTLSWLINGSWVSNQYTYTASGVRHSN